jgi:hypothetical protein
MKFLPGNRVLRGSVVSNFHGTHRSEGRKELNALECATIVAPPGDYGQREQEKSRLFPASTQLHLNALISHQRANDRGNLDLPGFIKGPSGAACLHIVRGMLGDVLDGIAKARLRTRTGLNVKLMRWRDCR